MEHIGEQSGNRDVNVERWNGDRIAQRGNGDVLQLLVACMGEFANDA